MVLPVLSLFFSLSLTFWHTLYINETESNFVGTIVNRAILEFSKVGIHVQQNAVFGMLFVPMRALLSYFGFGGE
jgi:hypothetical protein